MAEVSDSQLSKHFWALYWHQHWHQKTHRLALMHLGAHLQEAGYWAAYKFTSRFKLRQFSLADCFQIAFIKLEKGLDSFQPDRGTTLESFAKLFFTSTVTNELRRAQELEPCSDWLLLRKISSRKFVEALQTVGLDNESIEQRRLAWMCFKRLYAQHKEESTQKLPPPNRATWNAITDLYNQERLNHLTSPGPTVTAEQLAKWLTECIGPIRTYLKPPIASLNALIPGSETSELQDYLATEDLAPMEYLLNEQAATSRHEQQRHLRQFLAKSLSSLDASERSLLQLYYKDHLTQQQIAKTLDIKQYAVSRKLARLRQKLLDRLIDWCQETEDVEWTPDNEPTPHNIEQAAAILELWLQEYFDPIEPETA
ncbi:MAG: sigma-70 family RNA polymerase sigma factor [Cyanobacteria bacterium J06639_14]